MLWPVVVAAGCEGPKPAPPPPPRPTPAVAVPAHAVKDAALEDRPRALGQFTITFYYVVGEDEVTPRARHRGAANANAMAGGPAGASAGKAANDEALAAVAPDPNLVTLYQPRTCRPISSVARRFASQLIMQGTGKLHDGRVVNIAGRCKCHRSPCFKVTRNQWGTSGSGRPLQPFRTVAVDPGLIPLGSLLYIPLLEGRVMPGRPPWGGFVHDGCVVADDTGGHIDGHRLDFFVGRRAYFLGLSGQGTRHAWAGHVPVFDGSKICERKGRHVGRRTGSI